jgi:eukaryotic-like serine/threonine-protein kinase
MPDLGEHVAALFEAALALDPEQRSAFLDRACGDSSLRDEVEKLLQADAVAGSFLKYPLFGLPTADGGHASRTTIGPYTLLELIGQGGMGEVWLAEQRQPVRRRVAIKLIKLGMDTKEVVGRFESERQALALMDHPAIAKVFDAGSTPEGRPYFVMEYVPGLPITDYCDKHKLTIRQRLELFTRVCDGVQHAHQKAIIHRDLKPSNILVSETDGEPAPRIIDFGVSKAISQTLTADSVKNATNLLQATNNSLLCDTSRTITNGSACTSGPNRITPTAARFIAPSIITARNSLIRSARDIASMPLLRASDWSPAKAGACKPL